MRKHNNTIIQERDEAKEQYMQLSQNFRKKSEENRSKLQLQTEQKVLLQNFTTTN